MENLYFSQVFLYRNSPLPIFQPSWQFPGNLPLVPSKGAVVPGLCWIIWENRWRRAQGVPSTSQIFLQTEKHPLKSLPVLSAVFTHFCSHPANTSVLETHKDLCGNGISLQFPKSFVTHSLWHPERLCFQGKTDLAETRCKYTRDL